MLGVGAAACAVCCAGPIVGLLAALGVGVVVSTLLFGVVGAAIVVAVGLVLLRGRRRRTTSCDAPATVPIEAPKIGVVRGSADGG
jgi:hypothetical protein